MTIYNHLKAKIRLKDPQVAIARENLTNLPISGPVQVQRDGKISLGMYGDVQIAGLTLQEAELAIAEYLATMILEPKVSLDIVTPLSKFYYIVIDGAGFGEQVIRLPLYGEETLLDAISRIGGLPLRASPKRMWIARPDTHGEGCERILPVHWKKIVQNAASETNYLIFPGDRIYIQTDKLVAIDSFITKVTSPLIRLVGVTTVGYQLVRPMAKGALGTAGGAPSAGPLTGYFSNTGIGGFHYPGIDHFSMFNRPGVYGQQVLGGAGGYGGYGGGFGQMPGMMMPSYSPFGAQGMTAPGIPEYAPSPQSTP